LPLLLIDLLAARFLKPRRWPQRLLDTLVVLVGTVIIVIFAIHPALSYLLRDANVPRSLRMIFWIGLPFIVMTAVFKHRKHYFVTVLGFLHLALMLTTIQKEYISLIS
jgi:hypothetical protein